jgi:hypothetical protein
MSDFEVEILSMIKNVFPNYRVVEQHSVYYMGTQLFFDFYIPALNVIIECQGEQHYKYVPHFHGMKAEFRESNRRDQLKREWAEQRKIALLEIRFDKKPKTPRELFNKINEAVFGE